MCVELFQYPTLYGLKSPVSVTNEPVMQGFNMNNKGIYRITYTAKLKEWFVKKYLVEDPKPISASIELRIQDLKKQPVLGIK